MEICKCEQDVVLSELLGQKWFEILKNEFTKPYMVGLCNFIEDSKLQGVVFPAKGDVFNAYKYSAFEEVKVCIIGQDPYIRENQAHGLSFSVLDGSGTPSLRQIEKAVRKTISQEEFTLYEWSNNLVRWTKQGVMLLNAVLTVNKGTSNSHKGQGWETFTLRTIQELDSKGIIFLLWGKDAQKARPHIKNSIVFECEHPVAASYQGRDWNNKNCFNEVNKLLKEKIIW